MQTACGTYSVTYDRQLILSGTISFVATTALHTLEMRAVIWPLQDKFQSTTSSKRSAVHIHTLSMVRTNVFPVLENFLKAG